MWEKITNLPREHVNRNPGWDLNLSQVGINDLHWLWREAVNNAGPIVYKYTEGQYTYILWAQFHPESKKMSTNLTGCPRRYNHHVGSTCHVCGLKD